MLLGEKVKRLRTQRGLTLSALAAASGLTKGFISQLEAGHSTPSLASLTRLATALETIPADLISDCDEEAPQDLHLRRAHSSVNLHPGVPGLALIDRVGATNFFISTLDAGSRLVLSGGGHNGNAKALTMVRRGSARVRQAGIDLTLSEGDVGTWNAARAYVVENNSARSAELLICLPSTAIPPRLEAGRRDARVMQQPVVTGLSEGPFRLIAMRAERRLAGRP